MSRHRTACPPRWDLVVGALLLALACYAAGFAVVIGVHRSSHETHPAPVVVPAPPALAPARPSCPPGLTPYFGSAAPERACVDPTRP